MSIILFSLSTRTCTIKEKCARGEISALFTGEWTYKTSFEPANPASHGWECVSEGLTTVLKPLIHLSSDTFSWLFQVSGWLEYGPFPWHVWAVPGNKHLLNPTPSFLFYIFLFPPFHLIFLTSYFSFLLDFFLCSMAINMAKLERSSEKKIHYFNI